MAALLGIGRQVQGVGVAGPRDRQPIRFGAEQVQVGLEHMGHDQGWAGRDGGVDAGHGVAEITLELAQGFFVMRQAGGIGPGKCKAVHVSYCHLRVS
ncbi:hypothetical protein D9M68_762390 [compost metagenome]